MKAITRRRAIKLATVAGATALGASVVKAADPPGKTKANREPPVESRSTAEKCGPCQLFAVVDADGNLKRGQHVVSAKKLDVGTYEVIFARDVRRGAFLVTPGGHGYTGVPVSAVAMVQGRANNPRGVLVYTENLTGIAFSSGFHLMVVCPEGFA
jgi:hypothetical protein